MIPLDKILEMTVFTEIWGHILKIKFTPTLQKNPGAFEKIAVTAA